MRCCAASYPGSGPVARLLAECSPTISTRCAWATQLDNSYVAVQGPPGTGKTYGQHTWSMPWSGRSAGRDHRPNHRSIENVLREVIKVFTEKVT